MIFIGYIGNFEILKTIETMVIKLKEKNPDIIYGMSIMEISIIFFPLKKESFYIIVCDTVMGDCGELYVAPELVPLYKHIVQYADIITPNQFEAE
jgi:pyridoxine kinase